MKTAQDTAAFQVVIPTRDSAAWILQLLAAYRALGIEPLYVFDTRSADDTGRLLAQAGAQVLPFEPHADFVEAGMLAHASRAVAAEWVLRLDDDEFPSRALLRWVAAEGCAGSVSSWGLSRRDLLRYDGRVGYSRHWSQFYLPENPAYLNPQFRLYRHAAVAYIEMMHTAGYKVRGAGFAPEHAYFVHFDALIRSIDARIAKVRRYETIQADFGWRYADQYLPEFVPESVLDLTAMDSDEFDGLIASLPQAPAPDRFTLTTDEIRKMRQGNFDRDRHAALAAHHRARNPP